jgi:hypothetical protein
MNIADQVRTARNRSTTARRIRRALNEGTITVADVKEAAKELGEDDTMLAGIVAERAIPLKSSKAAKHRAALRTLTEGSFKGDHIQRAILNVLIDILETQED